MENDRKAHFLFHIVADPQLPPNQARQEKMEKLDLEARLEASQEAYEDLQGEAAALKAELSQVTTDKQRLQSDVLALQTQLESVTAHVTSLEQQQQSHEASASEQQKQLEQVRQLERQ